MIEVFGLPFMQRALLAGVMIGALAGYYGAFVVQRGLGFLGDGLAHAAFGGAALGLLLGGEPLLYSVPFTIVVAVAIAATRRYSQVGDDTLIGIFKAFAMALGVVFLAMRREYSADAMTYLFGSILSVTASDLVATGVVVFVGVASFPLWGRWAYATFDRELAEADGLRTRRDDVLLFVLVAVTVVVSVKVVGAVLATSCLVIPSAAARAFSRRFSFMTMLSAALGAASLLLGLVVSYLADLPGGAAVILVQTAFFLVASLLRPAK